MDVNGELNFFVKIKKIKIMGGVGVGGGQVLGGQIWGGGVGLVGWVG